MPSTAADRQDLGGLPLTAVLQLDEVCGEFEGAWQASDGPAPRIEHFLTTALDQRRQAQFRSAREEPRADVMEPLRQALIRELVRIDIAYRRRAGQAPAPEEYLDRFPSLDDDWLAAAIAAAPPEPPSAAAAGKSVTGSRTVKALPNAAAPPFPLPARFDDYELLELVARGGMGVVYKARQLSLGRIVALKMIQPDVPLTEEAVRRFHREARAAANLDHPNILPIHASGEYDGRPFFTMTYVEGDNLREVVRRSGLPAPQQVADLLRALAEAVAYAHGQGIIHRDLKPDNVLIDHQGRPRITDFGLAFQPEAPVTGDHRLTQTGQVLGTPGYMSPEQATGQHQAVRPTADVYSLGGILYFLLTGHPPFEGRSANEVLLHVVSDSPRPPRELNPQASPILETICLRCLEKDQAQRYPSADALAAGGSALARRHSAARRIDPAAPLAPARPGGQLWAAGGRRPGRKGVGLALAALVGITAIVWLAATSWGPGPTPSGNVPPVAPIRARAATPPEKLRTDFGLEVSMLGKRPGGFVGLRPGAEGVLRLRAGEEIKFRVKVAEAAYVGIWSVNADGTIDQLFPNAREKNHLFKPDEEYVVPQTRAVAAETGGLDWIWVQASTKPWEPDQGQRKGPFLLFQTEREQDGWATKRSIRLSPEWTLAEAVLKFRVEPR